MNQTFLDLRWTTVVALLTVGASGCDAERDPWDFELGVRIDSVAQVQTSGRFALVDPADVHIDNQGRWIIADRSDRAIKVFLPAGGRLGVGGPGQGPGEFQSLMTSGPFIDRGEEAIYGYDLIARRLGIFAVDGRHIRDVAIAAPVPVPLASVRPVNASLFLGTGWIPPGPGGTVHLFDADGHHTRSFMDLSEVLEGLPQDARAAMGVMAAASGEVVFSAVFGLDTVFVHDLDGRQLASGRVRLPNHLATEPVLRLPELIEANGGSLRDGNGWVQNGHLAIRNVIGMPGNMAAIQFVLVDFERSYDWLAEGGPVVLVAYRAGEVRVVGSLYAPGALLGSTPEGTPLLLSWSGPDLETVTLMTIEVTIQEHTGNGV